MDADDVKSVDDDFASWATEYDEALAAGQPDSTPHLSASSSLGDRQKRFMECLLRLENDRQTEWEKDVTNSLSPKDRRSTLVSFPAELGRFRLLRVLGGGGFGVVYLAEDPRLGRQVALKVPRADALLTAESSQRFLREARAAARLSHPYILPVFESGEAGPVCFYATAYCAGGNLAAWLAEHQRNFSPRAAAMLLVALAGAVQHAHEQGILHRDLKPANVLLEPLGPDESGLWEGFRFRPRIGDFGLAKILELPPEDPDTSGPSTAALPANHAVTLALLGTPSYMAPEQTEDRRGAVSPATDVYGLGAILYEAITGRPPFEGANVRDTLRRVAHSEPVPPRRIRPGLPRDLEAICLKCLRKLPAERYATAAALGEDLQRFLDGRQTHARPNSPLARAVGWSRRHRAAAALLAVMSVGLPALAGGIWWHQHRLDEFHAALSAATERERAGAADEQRQHMVRQRGYETSIRLAAGLLEDGKNLEAADVLDAYFPAQNTEDLRGFEWHYLWGQTSTSRVQRVGGKAVDAIAFSRDGRSCVSAGDSGCDRWDARSGQALGRLDAKKPHSLEGGRISRDGQRLLTLEPGDPSTVLFWDTAERQPLRRHAFADKEIYQAAIAPDGRTVAVGGATARSAPEHRAIVRLWDTASDSERVVWERRFDHANVTGLCFVPGGHILAVAYHDSSPAVDLLDIPSGRVVASLRGPRTFIFGLAFSPDETIFAAGAIDGTITLWEMASHREMRSLEAGQPIRALTFSPDGRTLAAGTWPWAGPKDQVWSVFLWDVASGKRLSSELHPGFGVLALAYSPDGETLAVGGGDSIVHLWQPEPSRPFRSLPGHNSFEAWAVAFTPDGKTLVSGGDDHEVRLWDLAKRQERAVFRGHESLVTSLAVSPDGKRLASGSFDKRVTVWDLATGKPLFHGAHEHYVAGVAFSSDGQLLASSDRANTVRIWDLATSKERAKLPHDDRLVRGLAFAGHKRLATLDGSRARLWDLDTGQTLRIFQDDALICQLAVSPDGKILATGTTAGLVRLWDMETSRELRVLKGHTTIVTPDAGQYASVRALAFAPDGKTLASGAADRTIRLWGVVTGQELLCFREQPAFVNSLAFSPDGKRLAAALHDGSLRLWAGE